MGSPLREYLYTYFLIVLKLPTATRFIHSCQPPAGRPSFVHAGRSTSWKLPIARKSTPDFFPGNNIRMSWSWNQTSTVMIPQSTNMYKHVQTSAKLPGFHIKNNLIQPLMAGICWDIGRHPDNHDPRTFPIIPIIPNPFRAQAPKYSEIRYGSSFAPRRNIAKNRESKIAMPIIYSCHSFKAACYTLWYFSD